MSLTTSITTISLLLLVPALSVDIRLHFGDDHPHAFMVNMGAQVCHNIPPGRCCQSRPLPNNPVIVNPAGNFQNYRVAEFYGLDTMDLAAVWVPNGNVGGCSGVAREDRMGPGFWRYPRIGSAPEVVTGGSYIKLPRRMPDRRTDSPMLMAQGIYGFLTGGGKWFNGRADSATVNMLTAEANAALGLPPGSARKRSVDERRSGAWKREELVERGINAGRPGVKKGFLWVQPPDQEGQVYPDTIFIDGTDYVIETPNGDVYKSKDGKVLDFTKK